MEKNLIEKRGIGKMMNKNITVEKMENLYKTVNELHQKISELEQNVNIEQLETEIKTIQKDMNESQSKTETLYKKVDRLNSRISAISEIEKLEEKKKEIEELKNRLSEYKNDPILQEPIGYDVLAQKVKILNLIENRPLTITDLIELKEQGKFEFEKEQPIDEYAFTHSTDYAPEDNMIKTTQDKGIKNNSARSTIHFAVNDKVRTHGMYSQTCFEYVVICLAKRFIDDNKDDIAAVMTEDTFVDGSTNVEGQIVLVPLDKYDEVTKANNNMIVIPVETEKYVDIQRRK